MKRVGGLDALERDLVLFGGPCSTLQATRTLVAETARRGVPGARGISGGDLCADAGDTAREIRAGLPALAGDMGVALAENDPGRAFDAETVGMPTGGGVPRAEFATREEGRPGMRRLACDQDAAAMQVARLRQACDTALKTGGRLSRRMSPAALRRAPASVQEMRV